jgi:hypothetical protein
MTKPRSPYVTFLALAASTALSAGALAAGPPVEICTGACAEELAAARAATAQYFDEIVALNDGFVPDVACVARPGVGGMGIHYIRPDRASDASVDARFPEVLLYAPEADGRRRLVGVEYFEPVFSNGTPWFGPGAPPSVDNPPPVLYGRTFVGPMPGHNPQMPWHYELHVWAWRNNPMGTFAQWNPRVSCGS